MQYVVAEVPVKVPPDVAASDPEPLTPMVAGPIWFGVLSYTVQVFVGATPADP